MITLPDCEDVPVQQLPVPEIDKVEPVLTFISAGRVILAEVVASDRTGVFVVKTMEP